MILTRENIDKLNKKYAKSERHYTAITVHAEIVNEIAQKIAMNAAIKVDSNLLEQACRIHDVASSSFMNNSDKDFDYKSYQLHAILGSAILLDEGVDPAIAEMVANHLLISVSKEDVENYELRIPVKDYSPTTIEGRILAFADVFHSKDPKFNSFESLVEKYQKFAPSQVKKLKDAVAEFGLPDLESLSKKYGHPLV